MARPAGRGGRKARLDKRAASQRVSGPAIIRRCTPTYNLLDDEALERLEAHTDWILKEIGVEFRGDGEALALFRAAGAKVDGTRVRLDFDLAKSLSAAAPRSFKMVARDPARSIVLGGDHVVLMPTYGPPFVTDLDNGRRYATIEDFRNIVRLTYSSAWLNHSGGTVCEPVDLPVNKRHLEMVYAHLTCSAKPFMGSVTAPERAEDSIAMARLVFGGAFMEENCTIQGNINVNSPLVYDDVMSGALKAYARANQSVVVSPFILGGAMGPVTQPALLAQAHAEAMVGVALTQLVRKGAPVVYGNFLTTMNLKSGAPTFGTPEANLSTFAIAQLCRRLGLPLRCGGHLTASKTADGQAMQESVASMMAGVLAGSNFVFHAAGWLEGGLTFGYEKICHGPRTLRHDGAHDEGTNHGLITPWLPTHFMKRGPARTFLARRTRWQTLRAPILTQPSRTRSPSSNGEKPAALTPSSVPTRIGSKCLADYDPPPIDPGIDESLRDYMARRRSAMPDQWH